MRSGQNIKLRSEGQHRSLTLTDIVAAMLLGLVGGLMLGQPSTRSIEEALHRPVVTILAADIKDMMLHD